MKEKVSLISVKYENAIIKSHPDMKLHVHSTPMGLFIEANIVSARESCWVGNNLRTIADLKIYNLIPILNIQE